MPHLLLAAPAPEERLQVTRTGGRPLAPIATTWPCCSDCSEPMQFLAQIALRDADESFADRLLLVFMCNSDDGCETWEAGSGANAASAVERHDLELLDPPEGGRDIVREVDGVTFAPYEASPDDTWNGQAYDRARGAYKGRRRDVLGHVGGPMCCVNSDDAPQCPDCAVEMRFVAQLEEGRNHETTMNFGGGSAFAFVCPTCWSRGAFLWEQ